MLLLHPNLFKASEEVPIFLKFFLVTSSYPIRGRPAMVIEKTL
jgi:hypothetical protein